MAKIVGKNNTIAGTEVEVKLTAGKNGEALIFSERLLNGKHKIQKFTYNLVKQNQVTMFIDANEFTYVYAHLNVHGEKYAITKTFLWCLHCKEEGKVNVRSNLGKQWKKQRRKEEKRNYILNILNFAFYLVYLVMDASNVSHQDFLKLSFNT